MMKVVCIQSNIFLTPFIAADRKAINRDYASLIRETAEKEGEAAGMELLLKAMVANGRYDGLVYENNTEDCGSRSWVPFHAEKVCIKSVETFSLMAGPSIR